MITTTYTISIKGNISSSTKELWQTSMADNDFKYGYSSIRFTGTEEQLDKFCTECYKDEAMFKIIGVTP